MLRTINNALVMTARELTGKQPSPTAGVIDSQSVKTTESGGIRGFDAGKKINGRKRHIVVDTLGLMVGLVIHSAGIQDRDGAPDVLKTILKRWPWLRHIFADGGYAGPKLKDRSENLRWKSSNDPITLTASNSYHADGWSSGRLHGWDVAVDWPKISKKTVASAQAWVYIANIRLLTRRIARA